MWKSTKHVFVTLTKQKTILYKPFITHINSLTPTKSSHKFIVSLLINLWLTVLPNNMSLIKTKTQKKRKEKKKPKYFQLLFMLFTGGIFYNKDFSKTMGIWSGLWHFQWHPLLEIKKHGRCISKKFGTVRTLFLVFTIHICLVYSFQKVTLTDFADSKL